MTKKERLEQIKNQIRGKIAKAVKKSVSRKFADRARRKGAI
jgi:hypothetical protein